MTFSECSPLLKAVNPSTSFFSDRGDYILDVQTISVVVAAIGLLIVAGYVLFEKKKEESMHELGFNEHRKGRTSRRSTWYASH